MWHERRIKEIVKIFGGGTPSTEVPAYWDGNILWLSPTEVSNLPKFENYIYDTEQKITIDGLKSSAAILLPPETICFTSRATIGDCVITKKEISTNQGFINLVCNTEVDNIFLL